MRQSYGIIWLPQCQWSNPYGCGQNQPIPTPSKVLERTMSIIHGIYSTYSLFKPSWYVPKIPPNQSDLPGSFQPPLYCWCAASIDLYHPAAKIHYYLQWTSWLGAYHPLDPMKNILNFFLFFFFITILADSWSLFTPRYPWGLLHWHKDIQIAPVSVNNPDG